MNQRASPVTGVHGLGYVLVTALVAVLVYEKFGVGILRTAWVNLDLVWALALVGTGVFHPGVVVAYGVR